MSWIEGLILGLVQGLTEFLPVSSSGHLLLLQKLGVGEPDLLFNVLVHLGTLIAVCIVYFRALGKLFAHPVASDLKWLLLASVPTGIIAVLFKLFAADVLLGKYLATGFAATTLALLATELFSRKNPFVNPESKNGISAANGVLTVTNSLIIGTFQGIAVLPGVSRSGFTISSMLLLGYPREKACEFSFLLSVPVILAAAALELFQALSGGESLSQFSAAAFLDSATTTVSSLASIGFSAALPYIVGVVASFLTGLFALKFMLKIVRSKNLAFFSVYTFALVLVSLFLL